MKNDRQKITPQKGKIYREKVNSQQGYEDLEFTGKTMKSASGVLYAMQNDRGVEWYSTSDLKGLKCLTTQNKSSGAKMKKAKKQSRNPFAGATDIYLTKNKIAVTTVKEEKRNNVNVTTVKTKYYEQNDANKRILRKVKSEVRRGRNGNKYEQI
ncbi:MAG: hypothetical protein HFK06_00580 [Clostridia bacterium]|nr:hypothetical protein [Clostridia bacterium]